MSGIYYYIEKWLNTIGIIVTCNDYNSATGGMTMSDIAISLWSSAERHGDTSESVVFHFFLLGVRDCWLVVCGWLWFLCCFLVACCFCFMRHLRLRFTLSHAWEWKILTNRLMTV